MQMNFADFVELIAVAINENKREEHRQQWVQLLPLMQMKFIKYMSFKEYEDMCSSRNLDLRPADEIIAEIKELHRVEGG